ncbi:hypothetical protein [Methanolacinia paynteri]|uniref:hypothetical protein n=1 Tax=Methanolacinia paynteri TaxID=230356 RepID=UPI00064F9B04|nr:hypothetical protein [Methanolacinia paynteri]
MKKVAIPPMIADITISGILSLEGFLFEDADRCPFCDGELRAHDVKKKKFATIMEGDSRRNITVNVRRFRCTECGRLVYADSPFYNDIRMGAPLVDFCLLNLRLHPANHISKILRKMNIIVNPSTIRSLSDFNPGEVPSVEFHEVLFPTSLLNISEAVMKQEGSERNNILLYMLQKRR